MGKRFRESVYKLNKKYEGQVAPFEIRDRPDKCESCGKKSSFIGMTIANPLLSLVPQNIIFVCQKCLQGRRYNDNDGILRRL